MMILVNAFNFNQSVSLRSYYENSVSHRTSFREYVTHSSKVRNSTSFHITYFSNDIVSYSPVYLSLKMSFLTSNSNYCNSSSKSIMYDSYVPVSGSLRTWHKSYKRCYSSSHSSNVSSLTSYYIKIVMPHRSNVRSMYSNSFIRMSFMKSNELSSLLLDINSYSDVISGYTSSLYQSISRSNSSRERSSMSCDRSYSSIWNRLRPNNTYLQLPMLYRPYTTTNTMLTPSQSSFNLMIRNILEWNMLPTLIKRNMLLNEYEYKRKFSNIPIPEPTSSIDSLINEIYRIYTQTSMISESEYLIIEKDLQDGIFEFKSYPIIYNVTNMDYDLDYNNSDQIVIHSLINLILKKMRTNGEYFSNNCFSKSESSIDDWYDVISKWHGLRGIISLDYKKMNNNISRCKLIAQVSPFLDNDVNLLKLLSSFFNSFYIEINGIRKFPLKGFPSVSNSHAVLLNIALTELDRHIERMLPDIEFARYEHTILIPIYDISIYNHICSILEEIFEKYDLNPTNLTQILLEGDRSLLIDNYDQKEIFFNNNGTLSLVSKDNHKI